jgi:hypothetical protein
MRTILTAALTCACLFVTAAPAPAGDREDALAIIGQAVKAHGGADALAKVRTAVRAGEGVIIQGENKTPFTDELTLNLPDQWRDSVVIDKKVHFAIAVNGDKGWQAVSGNVTDVGPARFKELREEMYVLGLETLTPLQKTGFDLAPLPEVKIADRPAVGVKVSSKGHADAKLYFDNQTHLLVKIERSAVEAGLKLDKEYLFGDYKDFDGVKLPTRQVELLEGKEVMELTSASYKFPSKPDEAAFTKP